MAESSHVYVPHHRLVPYNPATNPYRAKTQWPPDFTKLHPRYQFRLERRYKKRTQLKWARPRLMAWTRIAQWTGGVGVFVYGVFFMDWGREMRRPGELGSGPFAAARAWLRDTVADVQGIRDRTPEEARQNSPRGGSG